MHFVILVPNSLNPLASGKTMPLPEARPSAKIAKLFPPKDQKPAEQKTIAKEPAAAPAGEPARAAPTSVEKPASSTAIPLPTVRPEIRPGRHLRRQHHRYRHYRHHRYHRAR